MFLLVVFREITFWHFLAYLVIPLAISGIKHRTVNKKHNLLSRKFHVLKKYSGLFEMIESHAFSSSLLKKNRDVLVLDGESAGRAIRQLAKITNAFDTRLNLLAGFLMNIFFVWDIRQAVRLDRWKVKYKDRLPAWFNVMGEVDALVSFAGYAYNNPDFVYPQIVEKDEFFLEADKLGHPLIDNKNRVCNSYQVKGSGQFTILTGANMAGKSTFLRTVGINIVLASNGAPVCAEKMKISPVEIVTSIHTADSLANNESYFYAELKRLKLIIDMLKEGKHIFIILDEILKGTNSNDKQSGSKALVEQLISLNASGIIATHDLSLGVLQDRFPENVDNKCFEVIIENDRLDYDYLLKDGIARNMNATILMERMGITVK
jgi:DNA mismatch repair ATPase MutS